MFCKHTNYLGKKKEANVLTMYLTHFIYGHMALDI